MATGNPLLVRGYFSPRTFIAPGVRADFGYRSPDERLSLRGGLGLSAHLARGDESRFFRPQTSLGVDFTLNLRYALTRHFALTDSYTYTSSGASYNSNRFTFGLVFDPSGSQR